MFNWHSLWWQWQLATCQPQEGMLFDLHWTHWMAFIHASSILWASWWALVWLDVMGPVVPGMCSGDSSSPGGMSYSDQLDSNCNLCHLWERTMCISKLQWTIWVLPTPCHCLMVYTGRFGCYSTTTYLVFSQQSVILCLPLNAFCWMRQRSLGSSLEALIFWSYCHFWQVDSSYWCWSASS